MPQHIPLSSGVPLSAILTRPQPIPNAPQGPVELPPAEPNRPLGKDLVLDLGEALFGALGVYNPLDPAASKATQIGGLIGASLPVIAGLKLWHGTPHVFQPESGAPLGKFNLSRIGTGEGAQAYGHGLYFAESKGVANTYQPPTQKVMLYSPYDPASKRSRLPAGTAKIMSKAGGGAPAEVRAALSKGDFDSAKAELNKLIQLRESIETDLKSIKSSLPKFAESLSLDDLNNAVYYYNVMSKGDSVSGHRTTDDVFKSLLGTAVSKWVKMRIDFGGANLPNVSWVENGKHQQKVWTTGGTWEEVQDFAKGITAREIAKLSPEDVKALQGALDSPKFRDSVRSAAYKEWYKGHPRDSTATNLPRLRTAAYYKNIVRKIDKGDFDFLKPGYQQTSPPQIAPFDAGANLPKNRVISNERPGALYLSDVDVDPDVNVLDLDAPLSRQPPIVRAAVKDILGKDHPAFSAEVRKIGRLMAEPNTGHVNWYPSRERNNAVANRGVPVDKAYAVLYPNDRSVHGIWTDVSKARQHAKGIGNGIVAEVTADTELTWPGSASGTKAHLLRAGSTFDPDRLMTGAQAQQIIAATLSDRGGIPRNAAAAYASAALRQRGVLANRYADAMSRNPNSTRNTHNYVVFDDSIITILNKFGLLLPVAGAGLAGAGGANALSSLSGEPR